MRYAKPILFGSTELENLIKIAILGIGSKDYNSSKSITTFFSELFISFNSQSPIDEDSNEEVTIRNHMYRKLRCILVV
jgi:hypothetical protein